MAIKMTEQGYKKTESFFRSRPKLFGLLKKIYTYLSYPIFAAYPLLLIFLFWQSWNKNISPAVFLKVLIIPAVTFLSATVIRKLINAERPYERYNITPLIRKDTQGNSFPSRHSVSVFIIAVAFLYVNIPLGTLLFFIGIIMCISRVLAGVHFIKDVVAGAIFSILFGLMFSVENGIIESILKQAGLFL